MSVRLYTVIDPETGHFLYNVTWNDSLTNPKRLSSWTTGIDEAYTWEREYAAQGVCDLLNKQDGTKIKVQPIEVSRRKVG